MSATTQVSSESESRGQYKVEAYATASASSPLAPTTILRREPGECDLCQGFDKPGLGINLRSHKQTPTPQSVLWPNGY